MSKLKQAVHSDCTRLIEMFANNNSKEFGTFCREWKRMHFQHIYSGLMRDTEIVKITEEIFSSAKKIFFSDWLELHKIGALYLMYAVYYKQPTQEYCKICLTYNEWNKLKVFIQSKSDDWETLQLRLIFWKMLKWNAFRFMESDIIYGLELMFSRDRVSELGRDDSNSLAAVVRSELNEINHSTCGMLESLDILEDGYNEMKEIMNGLSEENRAIQKVDPSNIVSQLKESVNKIQNILNGEEEEEEGCEAEDKTIHTRRQKLKKSAFKKTKRQRILDEYNISLAGDMIQMTKTNNSRTSWKKVDTISDLLQQSLPQETLHELTNAEINTDQS